MMKMNIRMKAIASMLVITVAAAVMLAPRQSAAASKKATELMQGTIDQVIEVLRDPALKGEDKTGPRREKLRGVIEKRFSFAEMARRSLGKHWNKRTDAEKREFVGLFATLIENSYIGKIEGYTDEKVMFDEERAIKNTFTVKTRIITSTGTEIPIDYKLISRDRIKGGEPMVYDIIIEGVSLVRNYRSQFNSALVSGEYADLVADIKSKL